MKLRGNLSQKSDRTSSKCLSQRESRKISSLYNFAYFTILMILFHQAHAPHSRCYFTELGYQPLCLIFSLFVFLLFDLLYYALYYNICLDICHITNYRVVSFPMYILFSFFPFQFDNLPHFVDYTFVTFNLYVLRIPYYFTLKR